MALVVPVPDIVPPVQVVEPLTVRVSEPVNVPPLSVNAPVVSAGPPPLRFNVPPEMVTLAPTSVIGAVKSASPPLTSVVPVTL